MKTDPDGLRRIAERVLLTFKPQRPYDGTFEDIFHNIVNEAGAAGIDCDRTVVLEHWWHLARIGVIAMTGHTKSGVRMGNTDYPTFIVTERGRVLLGHGQDSPHYPQRYISAIKKRVTNADEIVLTYMNEAVGAWSAGLHRASAVMLGCACERLILLMAQLASTKAYPPHSTALALKLASPASGISGIFEDVRQMLSANRARLPGDVADRLDRKLSAIFDHARILRNATGHPTGTVISAEDAEAGLLMFPGFYELCDKIMQAL